MPTSFPGLFTAVDKLGLTRRILIIIRRVHPSLSTAVKSPGNEVDIMHMHVISTKNKKNNSNNNKNKSKKKKKI